MTPNPPQRQPENVESRGGDGVTYAGPPLAPWQEEALAQWQRGDSRGSHRGTLEVFTGGGKTLLALRAISAVAVENPDLRVAVVVPTQALQAQWVAELRDKTSLRAGDIGRVGGGRDDDWTGRRVLVAVLNSAARKLPELCAEVPPQDLFLVVDECHRAGAPQYSRVLQTPARYRLGLSATPDRDELDENGEAVPYDEQVLGRELGEVVFSFDLRKAREVGWLPEYAIHHHGVTLHDDERREYERLSRQVDDLADRLRSFGREPSQARRLAGRSDELGATAGAYVSATAKRKDLLYHARERARVTVRLVAETFQTDPGRKALLFHERVDEAVRLYEDLRDRVPVACGLEHSKLGAAARRKAMSDFAADRSSVLVSVKSLVEGLNVPASDVGVSVASSSSVRQRIQSLGRVLRRRFDGEAKRADMHIVYVADTVDELIYAKEDWSDLTGGAANHYHLWPLGEDSPQRVAEPPRSPRPTEEMEWQRLGQESPRAPERWYGTLPDLDYSVDTRGTVLTPSGEVVRDAQGVPDLVAGLRGAPGGRFKVTPRHRLVVAFRSEGDGPAVPYVLGQLREPFQLLGSGAAGEVDVSQLKPGDGYPGRLDKRGGSLKLRQKGGGVIERRGGPRGTEFAITEGPGTGPTNGRRLLTAWRSTGRSGMTVHVNSDDHVWFLDGGQPLFLTDLSGGLLWPSDATDGKTQECA